MDAFSYTLFEDHDHSAPTQRTSSLTLEDELRWYLVMVHAVGANAKVSFAFNISKLPWFSNFKENLSTKHYKVYSKAKMIYVVFCNKTRYIDYMALKSFSSNGVTYNIDVLKSQ